MPNNVFPPEPLREILSARQLEILAWAARGYSAEETAVGLKLSEAVVKRQRNLITNRLLARNLIHAVFLAAEQHLLPSSESSND